MGGGGLVADSPLLKQTFLSFGRPSLTPLDLTLQSSPEQDLLILLQCLDRLSRHSHISFFSPPPFVPSFSDLQQNVVRTRKNFPAKPARETKFKCFSIFNLKPRKFFFAVGLEFFHSVIIRQIAYLPLSIFPFPPSPPVNGISRENLGDRAGEGGKRGGKWSLWLRPLHGWRKIRRGLERRRRDTFFAALLGGKERGVRTEWIEIGGDRVRRIFGWGWGGKGKGREKTSRSDPYRREVLFILVSMLHTSVQHCSTHTCFDDL